MTKEYEICPLGRGLTKPLERQLCFWASHYNSKPRAPREIVLRVHIPLLLLVIGPGVQGENKVWGQQWGLIYGVPCPLLAIATHSGILRLCLQFGLALLTAFRIEAQRMWHTLHEQKILE
jgi:hypothetical protein